MKRYVIAVVVAPWLVPLAYVSLLAAYTGHDPFDAEPLLPGHLAAVLMVAYQVTMLVALPLWLLLTRWWRMSYQTAASVGLVLGISTASVFGMLREDSLLSLLISTGGIGGVLAAVIFRAIVGSQIESRPARGPADK